MRAVSLLLESQDLPLWKSRRDKAKRPHLPLKNEWYTVNNSKQIVPTRLKQKTESALQAAALEQGLYGQKGQEIIREGEWSIHVKVWTPSRHIDHGLVARLRASGHTVKSAQDAASFAAVDSDGALVPVRDALQGWMIDNDWRLVQSYGESIWRPGIGPSLYVGLKRL